MAVPTIGSFLMFGTGSNITIAGAIIEGGASSETVASTLNFNALKALADINKFDAEFKEGASTLEQIIKTTQFRGYPIAGTTTTTTIGPCSLTIYFDNNQSPGTNGWDSSTEACQGTGTPLTVYFSGPTCPTTFNEVFSDGKAIYTDLGLTAVLGGNDKWFKDTSSPDSGQSIQVGNDGFIDQITICATTTTTTTTTTTSAPSTEKTLTIETQNNSTTFAGDGAQNDAYFGRFEPWVLQQDTYPVGTLSTTDTRTITGSDGLNSSLTWPLSPSTLYINVTASFLLDNIQYGSTYSALLDTNTVFGTNHSVGNINWDNYQTAKVIWEINDGPPSPTPTIITTNFYSTGTSAPLVGLTCASTSSYSVQIFGDPGNDSPTFCGPDELLAIDITNILAGGHSIPVGSTFYLASGGQVRTWIRQFDDNLAYWYLDSCQACPTTTTTTTTTTTEGPLYYTLNSCSPGDPLYDTTITPVLASQRYVDPISGNFWVWDNNAGTSSPQQTVNGSLQIVSGQSGCP